MVISFSNVGIDSLVVTFLLHSTVKCGIYCQLFLQEVKLNLSYASLNFLLWNGGIAPWSHKL